MNFYGQAKKLESLDITTAARLIGVGEDEIHAVLDVEAARSGFDGRGRPKMLFEPHIFYRLLGPGSKRDRAVLGGLAYPKWKRDYPSDSYPRLLKAMDIDTDIALQSASWGFGQIMGFNHSKAGYSSAFAMVQDFTKDEENHLFAMVRFIKATGLDDDLRRHDWDAFARGYNGPGFEKNGYNKKLKAAFDKWRAIKDTPAPEVEEKPGIWAAIIAAIVGFLGGR